MTIEQIESKVCNKFEITPEQLLTKTRDRRIIAARQIAITLIRENIKTVKNYEEYPISQKEVGKRYGIDHSSVHFSCSLIHGLPDKDKYKCIYNQIKEETK